MGKLQNILKKDVINDLDLEELIDIPQLREIRHLKPGDEKYTKENQVMITIKGKNRIYSRIKNYTESVPLIEKLEINGIISTENKNFDEDKFIDELTDFFESKEVYFGGGFNPI